jgi:hypothetical protein
MKTRHPKQARLSLRRFFNGKRWESQVYPVVRNHIQSSGEPISGLPLP